ncbi:MAG: PEP/pyruvate-binding domain-containing protein [Propioniciclava sp.]
MSEFPPRSSESSAIERASTGHPGVDAAIDGLRIGDNVVWTVDDLADFRRVLDRFLAQCRTDGRRLTYVRFADHPALLTERDGVDIQVLDPSAGFETFAVAVHELVAAQGRRAFYVFDCLSELLDAWHSDLMVMNFFKVTCPWLYELDTIAWFALLREEHATATIAGVRETTQVLLDLKVVDGQSYVHPLKVQGRSAPTMFFPHLLDGELAIPVTSSDASARLHSPFGRLRTRPDRWQRDVDLAFSALDGSAADQQATADLLGTVLIGQDGPMVELARRHLTLSDLLVIASRLVGTGRIGGKAVGMLVARAILSHDVEDRFESHLEPHDSFYVGADVFYTYLVANGWWATRLRQRSPEGFLEAGAELHAQIPAGTFPAVVVEQFRLMLESFGQAPIIVRSSSLLEDNFGNAFAGKYDSFFLTNQGDPDTRLAALIQAVQAVYASSMSADALSYRQARGLADADEQMAVLVQRVSGDHHGTYFFPHAAGVGTSDNLYAGGNNLADAGMLRMVIGLGTRAVDRTGRDHARIVPLGAPVPPRAALVEDTAGRSQRRVDVLDLTRDTSTTVPLTALANALGPVWPMLTSPDRGAQQRLRERGREGTVPRIADFDGLLRTTGFPALMEQAMDALEAAYAYPVDIEFTVNLSDGIPRVGLVQCRPLQTRGAGTGIAMPSDPDPAQLLFASADFMGGNLQLPLDYVILVRPEAYLRLGQSDRFAVARQLGALNQALADSAFLLVGPGRWGTTTEALGVPVTFAEISHVSVLVETTYADGDFRPELSYGSHFFADLVEAGIFYCALLDDRPGVTFQPHLITDQDNLLGDLDPSSNLSHVIHVARPSGLTLYSDVLSRQVLCLTATPPAGVARHTRSRRGPSWRQQPG